ncbi:lipopolysaccharide biosynthesis protein [Sphingobium sp. MI1205]|uniref:lipopolysaccharide biosynthesis protein n=1 Tax=Sphingobium sp. MI1205 TaxID=407020 RepID=UPI0007704E6F|nr:lipopolysaccharide biosynthesis protein [Sphingobium sp. MI1205]AMK18952.1 capsule polysaccharide export-like protein [Sphingobium sp. MI1205]
MFMDGIIKPAEQAKFEERQKSNVLLRRLYAFRYFLLLVVLPTAIVATYYYLIASDQYESSADFVVRRGDSPTRSSGGAGALLGFSVGGTAAQTDALIIQDYLLSHDAVARLRREDRLVERFQRPHVDFLSALWGANPAPETLLKYYRKHVDVEQNVEDGITDVRVRAFTPADAHVIAEKLLQMGEQRVNQINERTMKGQLTAAKSQLASAERDLAAVQGKITAFRRVKGDIDPAGTGKAQIGLVADLTANLAAAKARLNALQGFISRSSPQYRAIEAQVRALDAQVASQNARLASGGNNIATGLGKYEDLLIRQEFAGKRYAAAAASYEDARAQALKQQLYLVRVVDPNIPVKSQFPARGRVVITVFFSLLLAYGIGWMLLAGVKEHSL